MTLVLLGYLASGVRIAPRRGGAPGLSMFSGFMVDAWIAATDRRADRGSRRLLRGAARAAAFAAHAIPNGSFAGAAGAGLIAVNPLVGLGVFSLLGAVGIGLLGRRGRRDVATALALVMMLGLGALFVSLSSDYAPALYSLLFGEVLGVSRSQLRRPLALAAAAIVDGRAAVPSAAARPPCSPRSARRAALRTLRIELAFLVTRSRSRAR